MRTVSIAQLADAIELNGYPLAKRVFFKSHPGMPESSYKTDIEMAELPPGELIEACAVGQAALNLGIGPHELYSVFLETPHNRLILQIMGMNDDGRTPKQIARWIRREYKDMLSYTIELPTFDYGAVFENYLGVKV